MKLTFQIRFHTQPGQSLWLTGNHPMLGDAREDRAIPMQYRDTEFWSVTFDLPGADAPDADIVYHYVLRNADGNATHDWGSDHRFNPASFKAETVSIIDAWNSASFFENAFYTEPFQRVLLKSNHTEVRVPAPVRVTHKFKVKAPLLEKGQTLCLLGSNRALGNWNTTSPVLLNRVAEESFLSVELDLTNAGFPIDYKYGVYDVERKEFVRYEEGDNRTLAAAGTPNQLIVINDGFAVLPATTWKGAGVAIPVFSLRSEASFGVGEFTDLKLLTDWCRQVGLRLIQILPVNDTIATHTWRDSYPYSAISAFALHPQYLNLNCVAAGRNKALLKSLEPERQQLNALAEVDYEGVLKSKLAFVKRLYLLQKAKTFQSQAYRQFFSENQHWLVPYAVFCHLRDRFGSADFTQWPKHSQYRANEIATLAEADAEAADDIALNYFIQYHLHLQLKEASEYAHAKGIILKGDIAIGVSRHGVDAWQQP